MRQDPAYFLEILQGWSEHQYELVKDVLGRISKDYDSDEFWDCVATFGIKIDYASWFDWDFISEGFSVLCAMKTKYSAQIAPEKKLPKELAIAYAALKAMLFEAAWVYQTQLGMSTSTCSLFIVPLNDYNNI